jgi:hypothetical protein
VLELALTAPEPGTISEVPYAESNFWEGFTSRYYDESHLKLRAHVRKFFDTELPLTTAAALDEAGEEPSQELYEKMGQVEFGLWERILKQKTSVSATAVVPKDSPER